MNIHSAARIWLLIFAGLLVQSSAAANEARPIAQKNVPVKMRDGVVLRADVLLPSAGGKFPVLIYRTPYGKENAPEEWTTIGKAVTPGYAAAVPDGLRFYSTAGEFDP